jgi:SAM-dependent methyltransferase
MAHPEQREFFTELQGEFPEMFFDVSVLEIGSLNINGTVRDFFDAKEYVGVDVADGPGVDVVAQGQELEYADNSFDVAVSAECFEHNPYWLETFDNMVRMSRKYVVFTCASTGRPEHGTSATTPADSPFTVEWDYYRNLDETDFLINYDFGVFDFYRFVYNSDSCDLYFVGVLPVQ